VTVPLLVVSACGSTAPIPAGAAGSDGAAGASGGASGGSAGAAGADASTTNDAGSAADAFAACGGDLLGGWMAHEENVPPNAPGPTIDQCLNLQLAMTGSDTFGAYTWFPMRGPTRDLGILFKGTSFLIDDLSSGPVTVHYAASCLASASGTPTCDQLAGAIVGHGQATGEFSQATCAAGTPDGCDCTILLDALGGESGSWSSDGGDVTLTAAFDQRTATVPYCVDGDELRFGAAIEPLATGASSLVFTRVDCTDGKKSLLETGVDCGGACPNPCK
jgi:hypothetical protein